MEDLTKLSAKESIESIDELNDDISQKDCEIEDLQVGSADLLEDNEQYESAVVDEEGVAEKAFNTGFEANEKESKIIPKSTFYSALYLVLAVSTLLFDLLVSDTEGTIFYFLIMSTIWQAASYVKGDK